MPEATMSFDTPVEDLSNESATTFSSCSEKEQEMTSLTSKVRRFLVSEDGPTAVEYAVMLALIIVACVAIVGALGQGVSGTFSSVSSSLGS
jgi:pilus assembly protein Flp/PilA